MNLRDIVIKSAWAMFNTVARILGNGESKHADQDVNELIFEEVYAHIQPKAGERILDIGCGSGFLVERFATGGSFAVGIDYINRFPTGGNGSYIQGDARKLPFADGSLDAIICYSVLHYLGGEEVVRSVLQEFLRILKPGGKIFLGEIIQKRGYFNTYIIHSRMPVWKKVLLFAYLNSFVYQYFFLPREVWDRLFDSLALSSASIMQRLEMPYHDNMLHFLLMKRCESGSWKG